MMNVLVDGWIKMNRFICPKIQNEIIETIGLKV